MKQRVLSFAILFTICISGMAQTTASNKSIQGPAFEELTVSGPVTVELIESNDPSIYTAGSYEFVNAISVNWQRKALYVSFNANKGNEPTIIRVYAKNVKHVIAEGGAR